MKGRSLKYPFIIIQLILYISFLYLDLLGGSVILSNYIKFAVVALCLFYVLFSRNREKHLFFLRLAMIFTLISDMLILLSDFYFCGVLTFIIAQQFHGLRISVLRGKEGNKDFIIRLLIQAVISLLICLTLRELNIRIDGLLAASIFYFTCILTNTARSLRLAAAIRDKKSKYLAAGMVLFLLCDINVGLFNLSDFLSVGQVYSKIYLASSILMWTFYAPSQVLISLSGDNM